MACYWISQRNSVGHNSPGSSKELSHLIHFCIFVLANGINNWSSKKFDKMGDIKLPHLFHKGQGTFCWFYRQVQSMRSSTVSLLLRLYDGQGISGNCKLHSNFEVKVKDLGTSVRGEISIQNFIQNRNYVTN